MSQNKLFESSSAMVRKPSNEEIIAWKARHGENPRLGVELINEVRELGVAAGALQESGSVLLQYVPIRLVTILEVFVRGIISELVNSNDYFFQQGEKLVKGAKIDLAFAFYVNRRELTIGDFVAHAVSLNDIKSVLSVIDTLLGDFASKLKKAHPRWVEEVNEWPLPAIISDYEATMEALDKLFVVRECLKNLAC